MYKGIKNISEETYISAFVYGLEAGMWTIIVAEEVDRMLEDYPNNFELMDDASVEEILEKGNKGVVGIPFRDRRAAAVKEVQVLEMAGVYPAPVKELLRSDIKLRGRPKKINV